MSKETRRVIVLSKESYQRLLDNRPSLPRSPSPQSPIRKSPSPLPFKEPLLIQEPPLIQESLFQEPPLKKTFYEIKNQTTQTSPEDHLLSNFPRRYLPHASKLLEKLSSIREISWEPGDGQVSIGDSQLNLSISQLLKAICVPFTKTLLPPACIQLLSLHQIKPRNHLLESEQTSFSWHPYFQL